MATYSQFTMAQLSAELALRLYDVNGSYWSDAERQQRIGDAIRLWNMAAMASVQWYALSATNSPWYDLQTITGSPRYASLTDQDVYSRLQYHLLEEQLANAGVLTTQFSSTAFVNSVERKRDEFLFRTNSVRSVISVSVAPNTGSIALPQNVMEVQRAYWLPASNGQVQPLFRGDQFGKSAFYSMPVAATDPQVYSAGVEPPLLVELYPNPAVNGNVEMVTINSQAALSAANPTTLYLPQDCIPGIAWGAIADLLDSNAEASDSGRAAYARQRYEMYCELASVTPFVMGASVAGVQVMVGTVESLDIWQPYWRQPLSGIPYIATAGQNLVCFPNATNQTISLMVNASATIPASGGYVQFGQEVIDAILDLAQHEAMFKQGMYEVNQTMPLLKNFMAMAAKRNDKIEAMSTYQSLMTEGVQQAENVEAPMEVQ